MSLEQELKLALPPRDTAAAIVLLNRLCGTAGRDAVLANVYFDTPDLALMQARCALRLRRTSEGWLQTLKAGGGAAGGLHRRHEWDLPVVHDRLDLDALLLICDDAVARATLSAAAPRLVALFRTDFTRTLWQLRTAEAEIEIALDRGEVTVEPEPAGAAGGARRPSAPLSEIELELKRGDAAALHACADRLRAALPDLRPDDVNKAQRGYALLGKR